MNCLINIIVLSTTLISVRSQIYPGEYELSSNVVSESGSSEMGNCSRLSDSNRVCNAPLTSVLFDGIPSLTGLDGDMWARQLLTFNTSVSSASITFNFTNATDNNGITFYTGIETIEVVMFNCPMRGIGAKNIAILTDGRPIDNIKLGQNSTSCDYLVRACSDATLSTTSQIITLNFEVVVQRLYVAEITFYSNMNRQCSPVGPITTSVITTTTSVVTVIGTTANATATANEIATANEMTTGTAIGTTVATASTNTSVIIVTISSFIAIVIIAVFVISFIVLCIKYSKKLSSNSTPADHIYELPGEKEPEPFQMTASDAYGIKVIKEPYVMTTCSAYEL